jgi:cytochrome c biogenesis protein CcmG, thiol:disulfide interchange protein DsbE
MMRRVAAYAPIALFAILAIGLYIGLGTDTRSIPSVLIGKPAPAFELRPVEGVAVSGFGSTQLAQGKVTVVNIFASWCGPCRDEHPLLMELSKRDDIQLFGINNKDKPSAAFAFLAELGQPYDAVGADTDGRTSIDWGGYGVPETFVVDGRGVIRFKVIGPLIAQTTYKELLAQIETAKK